MVFRSIIRGIYGRRYYRASMDPETAREGEEMFYIGFCLGARVALEIIACPEWD